MILNHRHLSEEDLALFALQSLEGEDLDRAIEHLEHCEECRHEVARFQGDLVGYALAMSEPVAPPAEARERLLKKVAREKKVVPVERPAQREAARTPRRDDRSDDRPIAPPSRPMIPVAERAPAERPLQQISERLAERQAGLHRSGQVPVAQVPSPSEPVPLTHRSGEHAVAERELFLASRGKRMFESERSSEDFTEPDERPRSGRGVLISMAAVGWAIAACMAVVAGLQYRTRQNVENDASTLAARLDRANATLSETQSQVDTLTDPNAMQVALTVPVNNVPQPPKPEGHVAYMANRGSLVFIGDHLAPLPEGKTYQLWLLQPKENGTDRPPVPAGTFHPDERGVASLVMPEMPKGLAAVGFGVTVENDGGSKTPTAPIILVGI